jgi:hypothetical protein
MPWLMLLLLATNNRESRGIEGSANRGKARQRIKANARCGLDLLDCFSNREGGYGGV